jgi:cell division protein FtsW
MTGLVGRLPGATPATRHGATPTGRSGASRRPTVKRTARLERDQHAPEHGIIVATVALTAIGVLMVYSSSAMKAFLRTQDTLAIVAPQIVWALVGLGVMAVLSRVDYRWLRKLSIPMYAAAVVLLVLVFVPEFNIVVGGSARWLKIGPLPAVHPAEFAKLALVVYLAHWFAGRGRRVGSLTGGLLPFLLILTPIVVLVFREPDLGTTMVLAATGFVMYFVAGANLVAFLSLLAAAGTAIILVGLRGYQLERIRAWLDPWAYSDTAGFHTIQGLLALGLGGIFGAGLGEGRMVGGLYLPNAQNDFIFAVIGEEFGLVGGLVVIGLFVSLAYFGIRVALGAPDTFGALLATGITGWLCIQAFINIGVVVALIPVTGITLPFLSAGGSSLVVSFAAVGILLSVSRETVEKGTWNDAPADRGRRHGRPHLPWPGRRPSAARATRRP